MKLIVKRMNGKKKNSVPVSQELKQSVAYPYVGKMVGLVVYKKE